MYVMRRERRRGCFLGGQQRQASTLLRGGRPPSCCQCERSRHGARETTRGSEELLSRREAREAKIERIFQRWSGCL
ncbi:hypothetical protein NDU88_007732 [Pleurodeles waltl]|uniref:Uncharacterized protein n=1 Tax=Pleurodeles waltl TaxID=8319 RepID=A0AAV7RSL0_PLEWA|nr:hypothetical protein NDU88_007732 [Pleurodeles waltl]